LRVQEEYMARAAQDTRVLQDDPTGKSGVIPYTHKPHGMDLDAWQAALRRQYATEHGLLVTRLDGHPVFTDYRVENPVSGHQYKVAIRDMAGKANFCECLDFKINQLGTCKHLEAVLKLIRDDPVLLAQFQAGFDPPWTSVYLAYRPARQVKIRLGSDDDGRFRQLAAEYFDVDGSLKPVAFERFDFFLRTARTLGGDFRCYDDALSFVLWQRQTTRRYSLLDRHYADSVTLEGLLKTTLYPYQSAGICFAARAGRALIADEMGLGKTIQAIGAAELLRRENLAGSVVVVCPTSLKYQWLSEIQKFTDSTVRVIEGLPGKRAVQYAGPEFYKIISYHAVANDLELINRMEPDLVILDEAQRIKNWQTMLARKVKQIRSPLAVVLTGTPLENKLEELYSIIQFIDPFRPGPYHLFRDRYVTRDDNGKIIGYQHLHEMHKMIADFTIRRRKSEVLTELPQRIDQIRLVDMTEAQSRLHESYAEDISRLVHKWQRFKHLSEEDRQRLLISLNLQRMSCDSTYLIDEDADHRHDTKLTELLGILEQYFSDPMAKVVVFSQWERMTRLAAVELDRQEIGYAYLHGGVPSLKRKDLLDRFKQESACRVFLSTDAGSTGLNLQEAALLINLDIPWNPAILEQRIARIHRLGQQNKVQIINLVARGTIEQRMLDTLAFKRDLADGVLDNGEDSIFLDNDKYKSFMNTVSSLAVAEPVVTDPGEEVESVELAGDGNVLVSQPDEVPAVLAPETSTTLVQAAALVNQLRALLDQAGLSASLAAGLVHCDPETGEHYLRIPGGKV